MPRYLYECEDGHEFELVMSILEHVKLGDGIRCSHPCNKLAQQIFRGVNISVFKPYVDDRFTGKPIEITTREQRDKLCKETHLTYDSYKYHRKPKQRSVVDDLDFGTVKRAAERGVTDEGVPIQGSVAEEAVE